MKFSERLTALTELFDINNAHLAHSLYIDASLISRWKSGARQPNANSRYYAALAHFFTEYAAAKGKTSSMHAVINYDGGDTEEAVLKWLKEDDSVKRGDIAQMFSSFAQNISDSEQNELQPNDFFYELDSEKAYIGSEGKRQLIMALMGEMLSNPRTYEIYFFADQPMDWFFENNLFYQRVITFLQQFKGEIHITLVHGFQNAPEAIFLRMNQILPLFLYADTHFYYLPQARRGAIRNMLMVVPGVMAITSSSVGDRTQMPVFLHTQKLIVQGLMNEFTSLISRCQVTIEAFNSAQLLAGNTLNMHMFDKPGTVYYLSNIIPFVPLDLQNEKIDLYIKDASSRESMKESARSRRERTIRHMKENDHYTMVHLATVEEVLQNKVMFLNSQSYYHRNIAYSLMDYRRHLADLLGLVEKYPHFHLAIAEKPLPSLGLMANGNGAMLYRTKLPELMLATEQPHLVESVFYYLENEYERLSIRERSSENTVICIQKRLKEFKEAIENEERKKLNPVQIN